MKKLSTKNWYLLRDAVLGASSYLELKDYSKPFEWYEKLPEKLKEHEVAKLLKEALDKKSHRLLTKAAKVLAGDVENFWLYLSKA